MLRRFGKLLTVLALGLTTMLVTGGQASAAHTYAGWQTHRCAIPQGGQYNGVHVWVQGQGSEKPLNGKIRGFAQVTATKDCAHTGGILVSRVKIEKIVFSGNGRVLTTRGAIAKGTNTAAGTTAWVPIKKCSSQLRVKVYYTVRWANGARTTGSYLTTPTFYKCV